MRIDVIEKRVVIGADEALALLHERGVNAYRLDEQILEHQPGVDWHTMPHVLACGWYDDDYDVWFDLADIVVD